MKTYRVTMPHVELIEFLVEAESISEAIRLAEEGEGWPVNFYDEGNVCAVMEVRSKTELSSEFEECVVYECKVEEDGYEGL